MLVPLRAENETRTRDPDLGKVVLYQLSYFRKIFAYFKDSFSWNGTAKIRQKIESPNIFSIFTTSRARFGLMLAPRDAKKFAEKRKKRYF